MSALVVYESMYGNTHLIADAIAAGLGAAGETKVVPVREATVDLLAGADLLVVGGPTHVHTMSRESTRQAAVEAAAKPDSDLELDPDAIGPGLREWFASMRDPPRVPAAAFDTRVDASALLTGRASKGIAGQLRKHGFDLVTKPMSFLVTKDTHLSPGEIEHARLWGAEIAALVRPSAVDA